MFTKEHIRRLERCISKIKYHSSEAAFFVLAVEKMLSAYGVGEPQQPRMPVPRKDNSGSGTFTKESY